jgi:hypothetical protein
MESIGKTLGHSHEAELALSDLAKFSELHQCKRTRSNDGDAT